MQDEQNQVAPLMPGMDEPPENLWEQLGQKRQVVSNTKDTILPIPGYDRSEPYLGVKYRLLDGPEIDKIGARIRTEFSNRWDRTLYGAADLIIGACEGLYYHMGDGDWLPLTVAKEPVRGFNRQLAEAMKFAGELGNPDNPRNVLFALFGNNDIAITQHFFLLNRWMTDTSVDVSREMQEGNL